MLSELAVTLYLPLNPNTPHSHIYVTSLTSVGKPLDWSNPSHHSTGEETKVHSPQATCSHSRAVAEPCLKPRLLDFHHKYLALETAMGLEEMDASGGLVCVGVFSPQK